MLGLVALGMSITIVNVAIPYIKGAFGMSDSQVQWLSTGFLASTTVSLLMAPWLVSAVGQRATFMGLLLVFIAASFLGGLGQSSGLLLLRPGLGAPQVGWTGEDTYIQKTGIARDLGTFASPDDFFENRKQAIGPFKEQLYRHAIRHWMNARVRKIRNGDVPPVPGLGARRKGLPKEHGHAA